MILYILIQSTRSMKLFVKMSLNETHGTVQKSKHLSDTFPIQNSLQQDPPLPFLLNFILEYTKRD